MVHGSNYIWIHLLNREIGEDGNDINLSLINYGVFEKRKNAKKKKKKKVEGKSKGLRQKKKKKKKKKKTNISCMDITLIVLL